MKFIFFSIGMLLSTNIYSFKPLNINGTNTIIVRNGAKGVITEKFSFKTPSAGTLKKTSFRMSNNCQNPGSSDTDYTLVNEKGESMPFISRETKLEGNKKYTLIYRMLNFFFQYF